MCIRDRRSVHKRWFKCSQIPLTATASTSSAHSIGQTGLISQPDYSAMSRSAKYNHAFRALKQVADCIADCGAQQFRQRMQVIDDVIGLWSRNVEVVVNAVDESGIEEANMPDEVEEATVEPESPVREELSQVNEDATSEDTHVAAVQDNAAEPPADATELPVHPTDEETEDITNARTEESREPGAQVLTMLRNSNLPIVKHPRGRPKGMKDSCTGMKRGRKRAGCPTSNNAHSTPSVPDEMTAAVPSTHHAQSSVVRKPGKPTVFKSLDRTARTVCMLDWFVPHGVTEEARSNGYIIQVNDVQCTPDSLASGALDSRAPIRSLKHYFAPEAWQLIQTLVREKKEKGLWYCKLCDVQDDGTLKMVSCDLCLEWYHWQCVGLNKTMISKKCPWLCTSCKSGSE